MITHELILKVLHQLNKREANTSLAMIGCILKGDQNSICSSYNDIPEYGVLDEKEIKGLGVLFDDLIDRKLISIKKNGLQQKYVISEEGLNMIINGQSDDKDKYFSSVGSPSDYVEENLQLDNTIEIINQEIIKTEEKIDKSIGPGSTGEGYDDIERVQSIKRMNAHYETKIKELNNVKGNPYFGRLDLIQSKQTSIDIVQLYIGNQGVNIGTNSLVIDWRSPIANYFYEKPYRFELNGSKYETQLIRKIEIDHSKIKSIYNELTKRKSEQKDTISDPFLLSVLKKKKETPYFTDIIASIQEKQNEIIRLPFESNIIVQGCAGSGKTMILLHRLAYLIYNYKKLKPESIKIVTPSSIFDQFVQDLSNQLGLDSIDKLSMTQLYINHINQHFPLKKSINLKSENSIQKEIIDILYSREFLLDIEMKIRKQMLDDVENIKQTKLAEIYKKHEQFLVLKNEIDELISVKLNDKLKKIKPLLNNEHDLEKHLTFEQIQQIDFKLNNIIQANDDLDLDIYQTKNQIELLNEKYKHIEEILNDDLIKTLVAKSKSYKIRFFSNDKVSIEQYMIDYKKELVNKNREKIQLLVEDLRKLQNNKLSDEDLQKLINAKHFLLNTINPIIKEIETKKEALRNMKDNEYFEYENELNQLNENVDLLKQYVLNYGQYKGLIKEQTQMISLQKDEDLDFNKYFESIMVPEIELIHEKYQSKVRFHNQYKYYYYLRLALMNKFGFEFNPISLVMIDEAQEYAITELELLKSIHSSAHMNYYGDINQVTSPAGFNNWEMLKKDHKYYELNENYRNGKPIVQHINEVLNMEMIALGLENGLVVRGSVFDGIKVDAILFANEDKQKFIIENQIPTNQISADQILHIDDAKGLEFNTVLVYTKNMSNNQQYIAFSRALENLLIA